MSHITDVSFWNGANYSASPNDSLINYDLLAAMSPGGVILRATSGSYKDLRFEQNYAELHARGVPLAAYHFFKPTVSVSTQAAAFNSAVSGKVLDFPHFSRVLDVEAFASGWSQATYRSAVAAALNQMIGDCIYTRASFYDVALGDWWPPSDPELWVAHYGVEDPALPWAKQVYALHQYEADGNGLGSAYGVLSSSIDLNKLPVSVPPPPPPPPPVPGDCEPLAGTISGANGAWLRTASVVTSTYPPTGTRVVLMTKGTPVLVLPVDVPSAGGYDWLLLHVPSIGLYGVTAAHLVTVTP